MKPSLQHVDSGGRFHEADGRRYPVHCGQCHTSTSTTKPAIPPRTSWINWHLSAPEAPRVSRTPSVWEARKKIRQHWSRYRPDTPWRQRHRGRPVGVSGHHERHRRAVNRHDNDVPATVEGCAASRLRVVSANVCTLFPRSVFDNSGDAKKKSNSRRLRDDRIELLEREFHELHAFRMRAGDPDEMVSSGATKSGALGGQLWLSRPRCQDLRRSHLSCWLLLLRRPNMADS